MLAMKKLPRVALALVLVIGVYPCSAYATDYGNEGSEQREAASQEVRTGEGADIDAQQSQQPPANESRDSAADADVAATATATASYLDAEAAELAEDPANPQDPQDSQDPQDPAHTIQPIGERTIEDGTYIISSALDRFQILDIAHGSTAKGARVQIYESNKTVAQQFAFEYDDATGYYIITNVGSGKVIDAVGAKAESRTPVQQWIPNDTLAQRWCVELDGDALVIRSALNAAYVLDVEGGSTQNYTGVQLYEDNGSAAQRFYATSTTPSVVEGGKTIEDGIYAIASAADGSKALDVASGSVETGANVQIWNSNGTPAQKFKFECDDDGFYTITNLKSGRALDAAEANLVPGTNVRIWRSNGTDAQKWAVRANADGSYSLANKANGLTLDAASSSKGANVQLWVEDATRLQTFAIQSATLDRTVDDGTYFVSSSKKRSQVLDVARGSIGKGAKIQAYVSNMTEAQQFTFTYDEATGYYTIASAKSGKLLDATGGSDAKGTKIQQWDRNGTIAQFWEVVPNGDGWSIRSASNPDMVFDLTSGSYSNGTEIQLWQDNGTAAQKFYFVTDESADVDKCEDLGLTGWYEIVPATSDATCFDIASGSKSNGAATRLWRNNQTMAQLFKLEYSDGYYRIVSVNSNKAVELKYGSVVPGVEAEQFSVEDDASQLFRIDANEDGSYAFTCAANGLRLAATSTSSGTVVTGEKGDDGTVCQSFNLVKRDYVLPENLVEITTVLDGGMGLDVASASDSSGANVQLWTSNGTLAQKWQVRHVPGEPDVYRFESACSGKYMGVQGANVCQLSYNAESAGQMWKLVGIDSGSCTFINLATNTVLDVSGASTAKGANIQTYAPNGTAAQKFNLKDTDCVQTGMFVFHSRADYDQVIDVANGSADDGANIQSYAFNDTGAQKWSIVGNGDGTYRIVNAANDKVFDVYCGNAYDGANIQQYYWNGSDAQRWYATYQGGGGMSFESALDRTLVLSLASNHPSNGTNLQLAKKNGSAAQRFSFEPTTYTPPIPAEMQEMIDRIYWQSSGTEYAIGVDRSANVVGVFEGSYGDWTLKYWWSCCTGAPWSPTITGTYWTTGYKKPVLSTDSRAIYCTQIDGEYFFHSILESVDELGHSESHGCVRMNWPDAWWIYCNIEAGTKVIIYN